MNQNLPLIIAVAGGAALFFWWQQRQRQMVAPAPQALAPSSVPQEWIESTPEGYQVIGTSSDLYDILT